MDGKDLFPEKEIDSYIKKKKLSVPTEFVMNYWREKKWETLMGYSVTSLAGAVNSCNSLYLTELRRKNNLKQATEKRREPQKFNPYKEQLQSEEWKAFREFILTVKGRACEKCGSTSNLQVHHKRYISKRKAWEYLPQDLMVLCKICHEKTHNIL